VLPAELHGPNLTIAYAREQAAEFLRRNEARYPHLDRDFILQICFEHSDRFDGLFPRFDVTKHSAARVVKTARWINENVRYDHSEVVDFWCDQFRHLLARNDQTYEVFTTMRANGTWHFPPVIIEAEFALSLGAPPYVGRPYYLIEGTHRVSYLRSMLELGLVEKSRELELFEISAR
jgi:hypothetical protein